MRLTFRTAAGAAVVAAGIALRVTALVRLASPSADWTGDARVYLRIAEAIPEGRWLAEAWIWPPGYPLAGAVLAVVGAGPALLAVSMLAGAALPVLALLAGRAAGSPWAGLGAAAVLAFLPAPVIASAQPLSDSFALLLVIAGTMLLVRATSRAHDGTGALAGLVAALAALTRPETLLAFAALPFAAGPGARRPRIVFAATLLLLLAPYVLAFHSATGVWNVSLKAPLNLLKVGAYSTQPDYAQARAAWGRTLDGLRTADGELDPRRIAEAADAGRFVRDGDFVAWWAEHARDGVAQTPVALRIGFAVSLLALLLPGPGVRWRRIAATVSLPFLAVPVFLVPIGRFTLPLLPAAAWGAGVLLTRLAEGLRPALARPAVGVLLAGAAAASLVAVSARTHELLWNDRAGNVLAAIGEGRLDDADRWMQPFLEDDRPEVLVLLAQLREAQGRSAEADDAFRRLAGTGASPIPWITRLARTGRAASAEELLAPLLTADADAETWMVAGNVAFVNGEYGSAAERFARAEAAGAPAGEAAFNRASALARAGRTAEAREQARRAAEAGPEAVARRAQELILTLRAQDP